MFSYTSSICPFANLSYFHHHPSPIFSGFDANNAFLNNQLHDLFTTNPGIAESLTNMALSDNITMTDAEYYGHSDLITNKKPRPVKKDRHSKICTAQGLRDRRVRLSIDIAREFFDLQDMLGFDKASKTLEWLLSKSRKAIKELAEDKNEAKRLYSISDGIAIPETKSSGDEKEMEKHNKDAFQVHLAKESRGKARAIARQRTREKIHGAKKGINTSSQMSLNQFNSSNDQFACNIQFKEPPSSPALANQAHVSEESFMLKRKWNPSSILTHQQNLGILSNDISGNSNYISYLPQNWDTDGAIPITNMNMPTTGLQSFGRPWETPTTVNANTNRCIMSIIDM